MAQGRTWDFTLNNYTEEEVALFTRWASDVNKMTVSKEVGDTGTPHLQGRITFKRMYRMAALKKQVPRAHWEVTKASADHLYVMKVGSEVIVQVDNRAQGKRSDLDDACDLVKKSIGATRPLKELAKQMPKTYVRFHKGFEALANELVEDRTEVPTVTVLYGPTGCGKSRGAREILGEDTPCCWAPAQREWFDGYCGQKNFVFEEFRGQLPYSMMLNLLDRYTASVQVKGGMRRFVATNIVITSPMHPSEWYKNLAANDKIDQLMRRITKIVRLGGENNVADQVTHSENFIDSDDDGNSSSRSGSISLDCETARFGSEDCCVGSQAQVCESNSDPVEIGSIQPQVSVVFTTQDRPSERTCVSRGRVHPVPRTGSPIKRYLNSIENSDVCASSGRVPATLDCTREERKEE